MKTKKRALGRGLDAILQSPDTDITSKDISGNYVVGAVADIDVSKIEANPFQPRDTFNEEDLHELAVSIREQGIIQPLTVRKLGFDKYQLIAGERRLRAARIAGASEVPCFIRVANDEQMLEMALIENIHRKDLNAIEIAISYQRLIDECNLTQEKLSEKIGKKRATISNYIRLLKLPAEMQLALKDEKITMGHARALINVNNEERQKALLHQIIRNELSVRQAEKLVQENGKDQRKKPVQIKTPEKYRAVHEKLSHTLSVNVTIKANNKGKGTIVIPFGSEDELSLILKKITQEK